MDREELINQILDAREPEEIDKAEAQAKLYMTEHPDDTGIAYACEQLQMMRFANEGLAVT